MEELSAKDKQTLENVLIEKTQYAIEKYRNLFNFAFLDELEIKLREDIKKRKMLIFNEYETMFELIDNYDTYIDEYIKIRLKEIGDN